MIKNKKFLIPVFAFPLFIAAGFYAHRSFAVSDVSPSVAMYGVRLTYPEGWKQSPYSFYIKKDDVKKPGMILASHNDKLTLSMAPKYIGNRAVEHPESAQHKTKVMLMSSAKLKDMPGVSAVQLVTYTYGVAGAEHYVASSVLIPKGLLVKLNLEQGKLVEVPDYQAVIKTSPTEDEVAVGFNSKEPLDFDQAIAWLQRPDAKTGYAILLSAKPDTTFGK